jgi:DNA invertase Pin-like site-specific DNA recombinase
VKHFEGATVYLIGYVRTSTVDQQAGFEAQRRDLEGTAARQDFVRACVHGARDDLRGMVEGMLAELGTFGATKRPAFENFLK